MKKVQCWSTIYEAGPTLCGCLVFAVVEYSTQGTPVDARSAAVSVCELTAMPYISAL